MKKKAEEVKKGDVVVMAGEKLKVIASELSDIGKQGTKKCRLELEKTNGEKMAIVRPADYPIEVQK